MNLLIDWISDIVLIVIFANFIDLLIPAGDMGKYVRVVVGFIIILVILAPLLSLQNRSFYDFEFNSQAEIPSFSQISAVGESLNEDKKELKAGYKAKLKQQISALFNLNSAYEVQDITVFLTDDFNIEEIIIEFADEKVIEDEIKNLLTVFYGLDSELIKIK